jgi:hypothetical protein
MLSNRATRDIHQDLAAVSFMHQLPVTAFLTTTTLLATTRALLTTTMLTTTLPTTTLLFHRLLTLPVMLQQRICSTDGCICKFNVRTTNSQWMKGFLGATM